MFLVLMVPTSAISNFGYGIWWTGVDIGVNYGFPFSYYGYGGGPPLEPSQPIPTHFSILSLIGDIIVWYLFSCFIEWIYEIIVAGGRSILPFALPSSKLH